MKLPNKQIDELFKIMITLWKDGSLVIERTDRLWLAGIYRPELENVSIEGLTNEQVRTYLNTLPAIIENIMSESDTGEVTVEELGLPDNLKDKLSYLIRTIENSEILPELDYRMHSVNPNLDFRTMIFNTKTYHTAHGKRSCPLSSINLIVNTHGQKNIINFEMTLTDVMYMGRIFKEIEDDIKSMKSDQ